MVRVTYACMLAILVASAVAASGSSAPASPAASRSIDRTVVCTMAGEGQPDVAYFLDVYGGPRDGFGPARLQVNNGPSGGLSPDGVYVGFFTKRMQSTPAGLYLPRTRCTPTRVRIALATTGLRGGVTQFGSRYKCDVPAKMLIRVRAAFKRPVALRPVLGRTWQLVARGEISSGSLAVTTLRGRKPIALASADTATGKARVFARSRCFEQ